MERVAELLRSGKHDVTEAVLEVGYSSLSHFSQAFCQTMGCCPGLYSVEDADTRGVLGWFCEGEADSPLSGKRPTINGKGPEARVPSAG